MAPRQLVKPDGPMNVPDVVTDTTSLNSNLNSEVQHLENKKRTLREQYLAQKKVVVQGSPMYAPYFGQNMPISLNGIAVYVPLNGQQYEIPESFAAIFQERISRIDEQIRIRKAMSEVQSNIEPYAGAKDFITKV